MASVQQLKTRVEKLAERIRNKQSELAELKTQHKDLKAELADARQAGKDKLAKSKSR